MFEEVPKVDFAVKNEQGDVIFRDALVFRTMSELRNCSLAEREAMMQERYNNWLEGKNAPVEPVEEE